MPKYMDIHHMKDGVTVADVEKAHAADLETQGAHDVKYLKYWVNETTGKIFCLVDAPNAEAANTVHREAHGLVADEIYEVSEHSQTMNLNSIMIGSEDPKSLSDFYTRVLGAPGWEDSGYVGWKAGEGMLMIGPHSEVKGRNEMPGRIILNFETSDVKAEFERIKGLGASVQHEPYQPGGAADMWLATFEDPDGNYFQIASPMPTEQRRARFCQSNDFDTQGSAGRL